MKKDTTGPFAHMDGQRILMMSENDLMAFLEAFYQKCQSEMKTESVFLSETECMKMLGIKSKTSMWTIRNSGKLSCSKIGKSYLYRREDVLDFIESKKLKKF